MATAKDFNMDTERLISNFEFLDDWEDRYALLLDLAKKLPDIPEEFKIEENKVRGCMSQVWMVTDVNDHDPPQIEFIADSDSHIVRGLIAVLLIIYSGKTAQEIRSIDIEGIFKKLNLTSHLSPNRRNGFYAMLERIRGLSDVAA